ncbi:hypothetical protein ACH4D5_36270 [Streptomyces sp. NPDC018029]|uniref:hypothetical protein n=1 Tax=Streptomyces sp. NPDC018029 TaxID=3365032 RepID=UPI00378EC9AF
MPPPSRRAVGYVVSAVLTIAGVGVVLITVFGGSTTPDPESSRAPTAHSAKPTSKTESGPSAAPTPAKSCLLYDFECQAEGGSAAVPRQPPVPPDSTVGTSGNGRLTGDTG